MFEDNHKVYSYDELAEALSKLRKQIQENAKVLTWTGPEELHSTLMASNFGPAWHISKEGLASHKERGRDRWDVYTFVAFQVGMHNGLAMQEVMIKQLNDTVDRRDKTIELLAGIKETLGEPGAHVGDIRSRLYGAFGKTPE